MESLPTPILGQITALTITTPELQKSLDFYKSLGFKELYRADWPFPWIQITDGVLLIMLRKDPVPYLALTYYVKDIDNVIKIIEDKGVKFTTLPKKTDALKRCLLKTPDGLNISLVSIIDGFTQPKGPGMLQMEQQDYFKPEKYVNKTAGLFGELAHPVTNLEKSIEFWQLLGFKVLSKFISPYPWAILTDGLSIVGLHQTTHFAYPAITYFAVDMHRKMEKLIKNGLKNYKEESKGNYIISTPEQQHVFLYTLGGGMENTSPIEAEKNIEINMKPVAMVKNARIEATDDYWGSIISEITLTEDMPDEVFNNITDFSHLEIVYFFDKVAEEDIIFSGRPRGNPNYPECGIFSQRKKDRPNRIGICTVELIAHTGRTITVRNLDAIDGTPVLDIKPVFIEFQPQKEIRQPDWVGDMMRDYWK